MPCDTVTTIQTVFKMKEADKLIAAAAKLGLKAVRLAGNVTINTSGGSIVCSEGQSRIEGYVDEQVVERLMKGYAEQVFNSWEVDYEQFQELSRSQDSREYQFITGGY